MLLLRLLLLMLVSIKPHPVMQIVIPIPSPTTRDGTLMCVPMALKGRICQRCVKPNRDSDISLPSSWWVWMGGEAAARRPGGGSWHGDHVW